MVTAAARYSGDDDGQLIPGYEAGVLPVSPRRRIKLTGACRLARCCWSALGAKSASFEEEIKSASGGGGNLTGEWIKRTKFCSINWLSEPWQATDPDTILTR